VNNHPSSGPPDGLAVYCENVINLQLLRLNTLIIHRVPKKNPRGEVAAAPTLSDAPTPDEDRVRAFFQRRIRAAVEERGVPLEIDPARDHAATDAIRAILADANMLTPQSRALATRLFEVQDLRNSTGLLVAGVGTLGQRACVVLLKIEHDSGIRAEETRIDGQLTFEVVVHDDLLLTPHTQLFKGAVFAVEDSQVESLAADMQVRGGIADFFLENFLGCRLRETSAVTTERFLDTTERWIAQLTDPEKQARYEVALLAQLQSAQQSVSVPQFAENAIDIDDHQSFRDAVQVGGLRWGTFRKDTSGIKSRIKRVAYNFASGIKIVGHPDAVEQHVAVENLEGIRARVTVEDDLNRVSSHG
jgi:hypothetical protein